jgi:hypothetical protein
MRGIRGHVGIATRRLLEYIRGIKASARATLSKPGTVSLCIGQFFTSLPTVKRKRVVFSSLQGRYDSGWASGSVTAFIPGLHGKRGKHDSSHTMFFRILCAA